MSGFDSDAACILGLILSPVLGVVLLYVIFDIGYILFNGKSPTGLIIFFILVILTIIIVKMLINRE